MQSTEFEQTSAVSFIELLEMLKKCEDKALQATSDTRRAELAQLQDNITMLTDFSRRSEFILASITGNLSAVSGAEFQELVPVVRTFLRFHLSVYWNQHIGHAPREVFTRRVLELFKKGKEVAKRERNLANRNVSFETPMDTGSQDPASTPATKAYIDRHTALLNSQRLTIASQDKLIKSINGKPRLTPNRPRASPSPAPAKPNRGRQVRRTPQAATQARSVHHSRSHTP
jgi:hypothetical protein